MARTKGKKRASAASAYVAPACQPKPQANCFNVGAHTAKHLPVMKDALLSLPDLYASWMQEEIDELQRKVEEFKRIKPELAAEVAGLTSLEDAAKMDTEHRVRLNRVRDYYFPAKAVDGAE